MEPVEHSFFVLAAERTRRKDPLSGFQVYSSGWNISDRHYWAVSLFTRLNSFGEVLLEIGFPLRSLSCEDCTRVECV